MAAAVKLMLTLPELVGVTYCTALEVPLTCAPKSSCVGLGVNTPAATMPLPDSGIVCGVVEAASTKVRVPVRAPVWVGVKVT